MSEQITETNSSCALFIVDESCDGISGNLVVSGTIVSNHGQTYFQLHPCGGFPIPPKWESNIFETPPDRQGLFRGCCQFLVVPKHEADVALQIFEVESRPDSWEMDTDIS